MTSAFLSVTGDPVHSRLYSSGVRNVKTVISDGAPIRTGGPQYPVPLLTYIHVFS